MLRCAGCGCEVSEWAARCSACARPSDDAQVVAGPAVPEPTGLALPDPPAAPRVGPSGGPPPPVVPFDRTPTGPPMAPATPAAAGRRRVLAALAAAAVVAAVVAVRAVTGGGATLPTGRVLSATSVGTIVLTAPDGTRSVPLPSVNGTGFFVAADGRYLATGTGQEFVLRGTVLAATGRSDPFVGPPGSWRGVDFTDGDRGLVATEGGPGGSSEAVEAVTFAGRRATPLGDAQSVVGDPAAVGVFAVVASGPAPAPDQLGDVRVERRDAGAAPVVLATTRQLAAALGDAPGTRATLSLVADPAGDHLAVLVAPDGGPPVRPGIVVLDRHGAVLGATPVPIVGVGRPAWSPDGRELAFDASTGGHAAIGVWSIGHRPAIHAAPAAAGAGGVGSCVWAVRGAGFLCASSSGGSSGAVWLVGRAGGGPLVQVLGPTLPFAWFPASGTVPG